MLLRKTRHAPAADESATRGVSPKPWARAPPLVYATRSTVQIINRQLSSNRGYRNILAVRRRRDSMKIRTVDQAYLARYTIGTDGIRIHVVRSHTDQKG